LTFFNENDKTTNDIAFVFPGQGSQFIGMGKELYDEFSEVKEAFDKAKEELAYDYLDICLNGPEATLNDTAYTQVCIYILNCAVFSILENRGFLPRIVAGHSLGEFSALTAAKVISYEDGLNIVSKRARLMSGAAKNKPGKMLAVLGADMRAIDDIVNHLSTKGIISVANYNCPGQIVISAETALAEQIESVLKSIGVKKIVTLPVSGAFHSKIMEDAEKEFVIFMNGYVFLTASIPVVPNTLARPAVNSIELRNALQNQMSSSVKWQQSIEQMIALGINTFVEVGPGQVLTRLIKRIDKDVELYSTDTPVNINKTFTALEGRKVDVDES
jgi:[acyl-carrier-protein] S-malonyltransferase